MYASIRASFRRLGLTRLAPLLLSAALATLMVAAPADRASSADKAAPAAARSVQSRITLDADASQMIKMPEPAKSVMVANPDIADVQIPDASSFVLVGKRPGSTTVHVITESGRSVSYSVMVRRSTVQLTEALRKEVPGADIQVTGTAHGVIISGSVPSPREAARLKSTARQFLGEKDDIAFNVNVLQSSQVNLRIRVAEVSRSVDKEFGFNWSALYNNGTLAFGLLTGRTPTTTFGNFIPSPNNLNSLGFAGKSTGGSVNVSGLIDALVTEGLITVLAEPNLTAINGETANFLAGGEFPIPVSQGNQQISIEFKRFGVSVDFTPTVLDPNRLSIKVRSEVSELTDQGAVVIDSIKIPGLAVRRAETTVELGSGESFAIAGMFQNNVTSQLQNLPWIGDVPILGALFRSDKFKRNESELVIIVTPYVVRPVSETTQLELPTDGLTFANDFEQLLLGRLTTRRPALPETVTGGMPRLRGDAGFFVGVGAMSVKRSHAPSRTLRALALAASLGLFGCAEYAGIPVALRGECPSWPVYGPEPHSNEPSPFLGCPNAVNLTNMVDEQTDLARGRPLGPADGEHETLGVRNYEQGKVRAFAPINAPTPAIVAPTMGAAGQ